jgi:hypothetical protein
MGQRFSEEEISLIRSLYPDFKSLLALMPGRSKDTLRSKGRELGVAGRAPRWTIDETNLLRKYYPDVPRLLVLLPGRSRRSLHAQAMYLKVAGSLRPWTPERRELLTKMAGKVSDREASMMLGGSPGSINHQRLRMNLAGIPAQKRKKALVPLVQDIIDVAQARKLVLGKITNALGCQKILPSRTLSVAAAVRVVKALGGELYAEWED